MSTSNFKHCAEYRFDDEREAQAVTRSLRRYFGRHYVGGWMVSKAGNQVLLCVNEDPHRLFRDAFLRLGRIPKHVVI